MSFSFIATSCPLPSEFLNAEVLEVFIAPQFRARLIVAVQLQVRLCHFQIVSFQISGLRSVPACQTRVMQEVRSPKVKLPF